MRYSITVDGTWPVQVSRSYLRSLKLENVYYIEDITDFILECWNDLLRVSVHILRYVFQFIQEKLYCIAKILLRYIKKTKMKIDFDSLCEHNISENKN